MESYQIFINIGTKSIRSYNKIEYNAKKCKTIFLTYDLYYPKLPVFIFITLREANKGSLESLICNFLISALQSKFYILQQFVTVSLKAFPSS